MSLVAHYLLDDNAASTSVADASGNGYTGTATRNTSLTYTTGKVGGAYNADGSSDEIVIGDIAALEFASSDSFTLACWCKPVSTTEQGYLIGKFNLTTGWAVYWQAATDQLTFYSGAAGVEALGSTAVFVDSGVWVHCAISFAARSVTFYRNGVAAGTYTSQAFTTPTTATAKIGNRDGGTAAVHFFGGGIDDVRVYSDALTLAQVQSVYNGGNGSTAAYPWLTSQRGLLSVLGVAA